MIITNEAIFALQIGTIIITSTMMRHLGAPALTSWLCLQSILANLLVLKLVRLFGLEVTVADGFIIGSLYALNMLREDFGRPAARLAMGTAFLLTLSVMTLLTIHGMFEPSLLDPMSGTYQILLDGVIPIMRWSCGIFLCTQCQDYLVFGLLRRYAPEAHVAWRVFISIASTQIVDTALFTYWALGGWVTQFWDVFIWSYLIKVMITLALSISASIKRRSTTKTDRMIAYVQV